MNRAAALDRLGACTRSFPLGRTVAALLHLRPGSCDASVFRGHDGARHAYVTVTRPLGGVGTEHVHAAVAHLASITRGGSSVLVAPGTSIDVPPAR